MHYQNLASPYLSVWYRQKSGIDWIEEMDDESDRGSFQFAGETPVSPVVQGEVLANEVVNASRVVDSNREVVGNESVGHLVQDHGGTQGEGSSESLGDGAVPLRGDSRPKVSHTGESSRSRGGGPEGRSSGGASPMW